MKRRAFTGLILVFLLILVLLPVAMVETTLKRKYVAWRIRSIASSGRASTESELLEYCHGHYSFGASYAVHAIGQLPTVKRNTVQQISELLSSEDPVLAREAAFALVEIADPSDVGIPEIVALLRTASARRDATYFAAEALSFKGSKACSYIDLLLEKQKQCPTNEPSFSTYQEAIERLQTTCGANRKSE